MLAKRFIIATFAIFALAIAPVVLAGERDLFVDLEPQPAQVALN